MLGRMVFLDIAGTSLSLFNEIRQNSTFRCVERYDNLRWRNLSSQCTFQPERRFATKSAKRTILPRENGAFFEQFFAGKSAQENPRSALVGLDLADALGAGDAVPQLGKKCVRVAGIHRDEQAAGGLGVKEYILLV